MKELLGTLLPLAVAVVILLVGTGAYIKYRQKIGDKWDHNRVAKSLQRYAFVRGAKVLDDVKLVDDGLSGWADHLLVGNFGVVLVYDLCFSGAYSGKADDENWVVRINGRGTWSIPNPRPQAAACTGRVNTLLKKARIKLPVSTVVVLTNPHRSTISYIRAENVVKLNKLHAYLAKEQFQQEYPVDVEKALEALKAGQVAE